MGSQQDIRIGLYEKCPACRGQGGIQVNLKPEIMPVILNLWSFRNIVANLIEYFYNTVLQVLKMLTSQVCRIAWSG